MKTPCPKPGKGGKIHPSPTAGDVDPTSAALRLLPAAILVLTDALCPEDLQVLAYLVTRSLQGAAAPHPEPRVVRGRRPRSHSPAIGCGCFECYTSFWSRWDCSSNRELIHVVIDAFEDHLAAAESSSPAGPSTPSSSSKRRDKGRRKPPPTPPPRPLMFPASKAENVREPSSPVPDSPPSTPPAPAASNVESDEEEKVSEDSLEAEAAENAEARDEDEGGEEEERKRGWADVMGMLNLRLWGIWSPALESAS